MNDENKLFKQIDEVYVVRHNIWLYKKATIFPIEYNTIKKMGRENEGGRNGKQWNQNKSVRNQYSYYIIQTKTKKYNKI